MCVCNSYIHVLINVTVRQLVWFRWPGMTFEMGNVEFQLYALCTHPVYAMCSFFVDLFRSFVRSFILSRICPIYWLLAWLKRTRVDTNAMKIRDRIEFKPLMRLNDIVFESIEIAVKTHTKKNNNEHRLRLCFVPFSFGRHLTPSRRCSSLRLAKCTVIACWALLSRCFRFILILFFAVFRLCIYIFQSISLQMF